MGGAMSALYTFLLIKKLGGEMALRIDDTNLSKSFTLSQESIKSSLKWMGITWEKRPEFNQSSRFDVYRQAAMILVNRGAAYPCFCSKERLEKLRSNNISNKRRLVYDNHCRKATNLSRMKSESFSIRLKNFPETVSFNDMVLGPKKFDSSEFGDIVLIKDDGSPTYNFACAWDDISESITHITRGSDHIINTPKQILIRNKFTSSSPSYAHFPLMSLSQHGRKMSKRDSSLSVDALKAQGISALGLAYYLVNVGHKIKNPKKFNMQELINKFDPRKIKNKVIYNHDNLIAMDRKVKEALNETRVRN